MKRFLILISILLLGDLPSWAQFSGTFVVNGDLDKYYPVAFADAFSDNKGTELELGRSDVHEDATWRGSVIAKFRFHTTNWGNGSEFINADINQFNPTSMTTFIAGWKDATGNNGNANIIIWMRGGTTHYHYFTNSPVGPVVYDGVQNALPFQETNGPAHSYKTEIDPYVNSVGPSYGGVGFFTGSGTNYFNGSVGIGTVDAGGSRLAVNGNIRAKEVKVETVNWPDYVFAASYPKLTLNDLEHFVIQNRHLPDIPSAKEVEEKGVGLGEMNAKLLKKIEELTLYVIEQNKQMEAYKSSLEELEKKVSKLKNK